MSKVRTLRFVLISMYSTALLGSGLLLLAEKLELEHGYREVLIFIA